jgi:hypothetical protein
LLLISGVLAWGFDFDFECFDPGGFDLGVREGIPPAGMDNCSICDERREPGYPGEP